MLVKHTLVRKLSIPEYSIRFVIYPAFCSICLPCYFIKSSAYVRRLLIWLSALYSVSQWKLDMGGLFVEWTALGSDSSVVSGELPLSVLGQYLGRKGSIPAIRSTRCCHEHTIIRHCAICKDITVNR